MKPQKILVVALGRIGDLVLVTPILQALKQDNPAHEVHLLAGRNNYQVVRHHPFIDRLYVYTKKPLGTLKLLYSLRSANFDIWIDPKDHRSRESRFFAKIGGARISIGYNETDKRQVFTHSVKPHTEQLGVHATVRALQTLKPLEIASEGARPVLAVAPEAGQRLLAFLKEQVISSYYFVNISGAIPGRTWQTEKWIALLNAIAHEDDAHFVLCCLPRDKAQAEQIGQRTANIFLYPTPSIIDAMAAVAHAQLILTVDTSIVHIASAFNKPIISLHANIYREYTKYRPISDQARCVLAPGDGAMVPEISLDQVLQEYHSLKGRLEKSHESFGWLDY
ncbi:MAG: glycosyltransferase family 9 protein [Chromatiales bacterium]